MCGSVVYEQDYFLQFMSFCMCVKVGEVFSEFFVSPSFVAVPNDCLVWPEKRDEAVDAFCVAKRWYGESFIFRSPTSLDFG